MRPGSAWTLRSNTYNQTDKQQNKSRTLDTKETSITMGIGNGNVSHQTNTNVVVHARTIVNVRYYSSKDITSTNEKANQI
jgi:hypothetical protein